MNAPHAPTSSPALRAALVTAACALLPWLSTGAQAQAIQKCRIDGRIVFQAASCPSETQPAAAPAMPAPAADAQTAQAAQAVAGPPAPPKKKTLAEILQERDGADRARPAPRQPQVDGSTILRSRMGAV